MRKPAQLDNVSSQHADLKEDITIGKGNRSFSTRAI